MPILPWACAHGEAAPVVLACAELVDIAPPDDSVDSNAIIIEGEGEILSLGFGPGGFIRKRIVFRPTPGEPDGPAPTIILQHNPPQLTLSTGSAREITEESYGEYVCNDQGHWFELYFTGTGASSAENKLIALERRINELELKQSKRDRKRTKHSTGD